MPALDVFRADAFSTLSLTEAIEKLPFAPSRIGSMNLFTSRGVPTTTVAIEERDGKLSLIPTAARGTMPTTAPARTRTVRNFEVPHLPHNASIQADEVQNIRSFGSENTLQGVAQVVNEKMSGLKQDHEVTWEYHRIGAIKGNILDADGSTVIYNLFTEFGITQDNTNINFSTSTTVRSEIVAIKRKMEAALGAAAYSGLRVFCGDTFFDNFVENADVKAAFDRWNNGQFLRDDPRFTAFEFPRGVFWENYRGSVGGVGFVAANQAHMIPMGVPGLFVRWNAPANFVETVNTVGRELYAKQEQMKFDMGVELHTQSNPLHICVRPKTLQLITDTSP